MRKLGWKENAGIAVMFESHVHTCMPYKRSYPRTHIHNQRPAEGLCRAYAGTAGLLLMLGTGEPHMVPIMPPACVHALQPLMQLRCSLPCLVCAPSRAVNIATQQARSSPGSHHLPQHRS